MAHIGVYRDEEKFKVQACNDFFVFTGNTIATLLTGVFFAHAGWKVLIVTMAVFLLANVVYVVINILHASENTTEEEEGESPSGRLLATSQQHQEHSSTTET